MTRAGKVIAFIESLKLTAGAHAGKPFRLRPWQKAMVRQIYRTKGGNRVVRQALFTCGRKNGKTQLAAALALCHLAGLEAEARGEVYSAAADRNQAGRTFRELEAFILTDPDLADRCNIRRFHKQIEVMHGEGAGSTFEALSPDATKAHSLSPSAIIMDESRSPARVAAGPRAWHSMDRRGMPSARRRPVPPTDPPAGTRQRSVRSAGPAGPR
jgi:phage terminase large subunit-like protein